MTLQEEYTVRRVRGAAATTWWDQGTGLFYRGGGAELGPKRKGLEDPSHVWQRPARAGKGLGIQSSESCGDVLEDLYG